MTEVLLCWHSKGNGLVVLEQAIKSLRNRRILVDKVVYLVQEADLNIPRTIEGASIEGIELPVEDPTKHEDIYALVKDNVLPRVFECEGTLHVNVSPGTPAMHSVWLILHAGGAFPVGTRLWSSQYSRETKRARIDPVNFAVNTYLSEINKLQRLEPERAIYEPDALSPVRHSALDRLARYSRVTGAPLLILGERGTGKTRLVETYVTTLKNCDNVVTVACGGLDSALAESVLFGHHKGAFTGAEQDRKGLLAEAHGGILFLDEVQDLPKFVQRKLVRVFQDRKRKYRSVGSDKEEIADFELVCASNLSVDELRKQLDDDFFDRLSHLVVRMPSLRECREDLRRDWLKVWREIRQRGDLPLEAPWSVTLEGALKNHPLPGNLRDLQRLAVLVMAWWDRADLDATLESALQEWSHWTSSTILDSTFGNGSRSERTKWFRARLAQWAKETYSTWVAAGEALDCDEKTLRQDVVFLRRENS